MEIDPKELITRRRLQILIHSCIYYRFDDSIIDDHTYDQWATELAELQEQYPEEAAKAPFSEDFKDFDGSTGFDLPIHHPEIIARANHVRRYARKMRS